MKVLSSVRWVRLLLAAVVVAMMGSLGLKEAGAEGGGDIVLEEVVVTAMRVARPIGDLPMSVSIITREEIERTYAKTVDDLLDRAVGVQVRRPRGLTVTGALTTVRMRGTASGARVLILLDGVPLNTKLFGGVGLLNSMSVQNIERIEIVRGASSAIHGSSAMGGVINIITRRAAMGFSGNVSLESGSFDTQIGSLGVEYGAERFGIRFAAERKQTGGYEFRDPWDPLWRLPEMELNHISLGADLWLGESLLRFGISNFREDSLVGTRDRHDAQRETNKYRVSLEAPIWGGADFSIKGFYFDNDTISKTHRLNRDTGEFDIFRGETHRHYPDYGMLTQVAFELGKHHLTAGVDFRSGSIENIRTFPGGEKRKFEGAQSLWAAFINNEMRLGDRVILSAGVRYDWWENREGRFYDHVLGRWKEFPTATDSALSPRGGVVYKLTEGARLRASLGTGFRAPSLWDMFRSGPHGRTYDLGNPELGPERLDWSFDIGVDMQPHENLNLSLTFYQSRLSDFLERETLAPGDPGIPLWLDSGGLPVRRMINIGEVDIHGVEAGLEVTFNKKWSAFVNHTFNVSRVRGHKTDPAMAGNYLPNTPRHVNTIGVTYDNPRLFTLSLGITNEGSRYRRLRNEEVIEGFTVVNMRISRKLLNGMEIFANVENLTDEEYREAGWASSPPFNMLVGMRKSF